MLIRFSLLRLAQLLLASSAPWFIFTVAHADLYVYGDTHANATREIRLSNIPVESGFHLLIAENSPEPTALNSQSGAAPALSSNSLPFDDIVHVAAAETSMDPALLHAVINAESHHDTHARSPRGAQGLMQLMPAIARRFQVSDPYDPAQNVLAGARYLRELLDLYKGDLRLALAAYNSGTEAVDRFGRRIPPYGETRRYVPRVMQFYRKLSNGQM
jgi:soluble lytic murein transglycosylase-like protein